MTYTSTYPDVSIPDTLLTPYVMRHAERLADSPALIRKRDRADNHLRRVAHIH